MEQNQKTKNEFIGWFFLFLIIIAIILAIFAGQFFKSEAKLEIAFKNGQPISFFIAVYNDNKNIVGSNVIFFNPVTNRILSVGILPKTLVYYNKKESFTIEEAFNKKVSNEDLKKAIGIMLGTKIDYYIYININNFIKLVDLYGGVEIYSTGVKITTLNVNIPSGVTLLDGDKSIEYLSYKVNDSLEEQYEHLKRIENFLRGFFQLKYDFKESFNEFIISNYIYKLMTSNLSVNDFIIIYKEIIKRFNKDINDFSKGMIYLIVYCDKKLVEGYDYILQPKKNGEWIKGEVRESVENLNKEWSNEEIGKIVVEILNGTDIVGFAIRTKKYLNSFGFDVLELGNADNDNYENTIIIIRNSEQKARKLADLIHCKRIIKGKESPDKKIDATLILGRDFNGRVVR